MNNTFIKSLIGITLFLILPGTVSAQSFLDKVLKGVEKTNKLLNFVLCFLILVLLVIIGFIAYSLLKAGGKI